MTKILLCTVAEIWKGLKGWPSYEVSNLGRVRRTRDSNPNKSNGVIRYKTGYMLAINFNRKGYPFVKVGKANGRKKFYINRIVCEAFNGPPPSPKHHAAHWDGDVTNNFPNNLRWATAKENCEDKIRIGRTNRGIRNPHNKLTEWEALLIRFLSICTDMPRKDIAQAFNISPETVSSIKSYNHWKWLA